MAATDARPLPKKGVAYRHYFAIRKNDGTLITSWTGQDSEVDKDGAGFSDCTNEATEISTSGVGYIDLTSTEMNADAVNLKVTVTNTSALPYVVTLFPEEAGDVRVDVTQVGSNNITATGGRMEVNTSHWGGTAVGSANVLIDGAITAAKIATDAIDADAIAASAVAEIQSGLAQNADIQTILTNLAVVDATADAILLDTAEIGAAGAGLTAIPWNASWDAEVQSEVDDALIAKGLDHLVFASVAGADVADNSIFAKLVSKSATADWDSFSNTTDALEALRDRGDAAWITATGFSTLDAAGVRTAIGLASANLDSQLAALDTAVDAIDADVTTLLANLATVDGNVDAILLDTGTDGVAISSAAIDSLWDDAITEPAGMFAWASATPRKILQTLGVLMRNEATSDGNSVDIKSDAGLTLWSYPSSDDGSVFTSGEAV